MYHLSASLFYCNNDLRLPHTLGMVCSYALNWVASVQMEQLEEAGIKKVVCLAVAEPEQVSEWANKVGLSDSKIETWADTKGAWTRMLGLDENQFDAPGPRSQRYVSFDIRLWLVSLCHTLSSSCLCPCRYAGLIDNGVLLKLVSNVHYHPAGLCTCSMLLLHVCMDMCVRSPLSSRHMCI